MQHLNEAIKASTILVLQWIYHYFYFLSPLWWGFGIAITVTLIFAGFRLIRFSHPKSPRLSQLIRHLSYPLIFWPSLAVLLTILMGWLILIWISKEHHILNNVLLAMASRLQSIGVGAGFGILTGGGFFYWIIPGWERPAVSVAEPDAEIPVFSDYDPETYFRV